MDEPFGALDALTREHLQGCCSGSPPTKDLTVLFVTHSVDEAIFLSDRIVVMGVPGRMIGEFNVGLPRPRQDYDWRATPDYTHVRRIGGGTRAHPGTVEIGQSGLRGERFRAHADRQRRRGHTAIAGPNGPRRARVTLIASATLLTLRPCTHGGHENPLASKQVVRKHPRYVVDQRAVQHPVGDDGLPVKYFVAVTHASAGPSPFDCRAGARLPLRILST